MLKDRGLSGSTEQVPQHGWKGGCSGAHVPGLGHLTLLRTQEGSQQRGQEDLHSGGTGVPSGVSEAKAAHPAPETACWKARLCPLCKWGEGPTSFQQQGQGEGLSAPS